MLKPGYQRALWTGALFGLCLSSQAMAGLQVSGTQLLEDNNTPFIMRGVNHPHAWYNDQTAAFEHIAEAGANTVRVVLSDGQQFVKSSAEDVAQVIRLCKNNRLICVLEVHDVTGSGEKPEAGTIAKAADYWVELAPVLEGEEDYLIINIANEPLGNGPAPSEWVTQHIDAIQKIRAAGLTHALMIDAANWGQDWQEIMLNNAKEVAAADELANTLFSVHMYQVFQSRDKIENYVKTFLNTQQLPLVIGEFGPDHQGQDVDEDSIMAVSEAYQIGYLGWSWSGNTGNGTESLDITQNFDPNNMSPWGIRLFDGPNGIRETSVLATVYDDVAVEPPMQCNWYGTVVPICELIDDGQGIENGQNCVGINTCRMQDGDGGVIGENPTDPTDPLPSTACSYRVVSQWSTGFQAEIAVTNNGDQAVTEWEVHWTYADGSLAGSVWNAAVIGTDQYVATPLEWNSRIDPGQSVSFGFTGTGQGEAVLLTGPSCQS